MNNIFFSFSSTDDLVKLISESIERIRQSTSPNVRQSTMMFTMELLKASGREDLCKQFVNEIAKETGASAEVIADDNLNEENMEVDDEQEDKHKKQSSISEYNDVDYRFLDQDIDHRMPTITPENKGRSDVLSSDRDADDRTIKSSLMEERKEKRGNDSDFRKSDAKLTSPR